MGQTGFCVAVYVRAAQLLLLPFLVESPVYLLASGKTEAAVSAMVQLGFSSQEQQRLLLLAPRLAGRGREEGSELQDVFQTNAPPTPPAAADVSCADLAAAEASSSLALERETPPSRATQRNGMLVGQEGEDDLASRKKALSSKRGLLWQLALPAGLGVLHNLLFVNSFLLMAPDIILLIGRCDASVAVACVGGAKVRKAFLSPLQEERRPSPQQLRVSAAARSSGGSGRCTFCADGGRLDFSWSRRQS